MDTREIGCCGACCRTCREYGKACKGCKTGYENGSRDLARAKCRIKVCCIGRGQATCADCPGYDSCPIIQAFHGHAGYKYGRYRQAIAFIRAHGYEAFLERTAGWTSACGKL